MGACHGGLQYYFRNLESNKKLFEVDVVVQEV